MYFRRRPCHTRKSSVLGNRSNSAEGISYTISYSNKRACFRERTTHTTVLHCCCNRGRKTLLRRVYMRKPCAFCCWQVRGLDFTGITKTALPLKKHERDCAILLCCYELLARLAANKGLTNQRVERTHFLGHCTRRSMREKNICSENIALCITIP